MAAVDDSEGMPTGPSSELASLSAVHKVAVVRTPRLGWSKRSRSHQNQIVALSVELRSERRAARKGRKLRYSGRFEILRSTWEHTLQYCKFHKSLETELSAICWSDFTVSRAKFLTSFVLSLENRGEVQMLEETLHIIFDCFDVGGTGRIDYREFVCALLYVHWTFQLRFLLIQQIFRPYTAATTPLTQILKRCFQVYDDDGSASLTIANLVRVLCVFCADHHDVRRVLHLVRGTKFHRPSCSLIRVRRQGSVR